MSKFLTNIISRAKADLQTIVLPEGNDPRTLEAARSVVDQNIARVIVLGTEEEIASHGVDLEGIEHIDPATSDKLPAYAEKLAELRAKKGMTVEQATEIVKDVSYFGVMMVYMDDADGMVSGACHSTADTLRPCLQILKTAPGTKIVSSFFVMDVPDCEYGSEGLFIFSDCGLNIAPSAEDVSEIAIASAASFESLAQEDARVAMLCHSSYGSSKGDNVDKMRAALEMVREKAPQLQIDGELQGDAAIVPSIGQVKAPGSSVAGLANVLIFPDIDAGNIAYKLVQRLAKADAYGPITQGMAKPVNDLSRGCSAPDIVGVVGITCVQSQARKAAL